jgi:hypothetical protein
MKYYGLLLIAILIILGACDIQKPTLPGWDVDLALPLINQRFYAYDLADGTNIVIDSTQVLNLQNIGENTTPEFSTIPFKPDVDVDSIPVPGTGYTGFLPFVDSYGSVQVAYAEIASGIMKHRFTNVSSSVEEISLVLHNFYTASGEELTLTYDGNNGWITTSLEGIHMGTENSQQLISEIPFSIVVSPVLPVTAMVADFSFLSNTDWEFSSIQGALDNYALHLQDADSTIDIDYPYGINDAVTLQQATIVMEIENHVGFAAEFSGKFRASNDQGDVQVIDIVDENGNNYHTEPALSSTSPGMSYLEFTSNISELLQIMPTRIDILDGTFTISTGQAIGSAHSTDIVKINYRLNAPFTFILHEHPIIINEETVISITEDNRARIRDNALGAEINLKMLNTLPVGAWADAYFSNTPNIDVSNPETYSFLKHAEISSSEVNPSWQDVELSLSKAELDLFTQPNVYLRWRFSFMETGEPVTIHATTADYIHIKGMMNASIRMEGSE